MLLTSCPLITMIKLAFLRNDGRDWPRISQWDGLFAVLYKLEQLRV